MADAVEEVWISVQRAAEDSGIPIRTLYAAIGQGRVRSRKPNGLLEVAGSDVAEMAANRTVPPRRLLPEEAAAPVAAGGGGGPRGELKSAREQLELMRVEEQRLRAENSLRRARLEAQRTSASLAAREAVEARAVEEAERSNLEAEVRALDDQRRRAWIEGWLPGVAAWADRDLGPRFVAPAVEAARRALERLGPGVDDQTTLATIQGELLVSLAGPIAEARAAQACRDLAAEAATLVAQYGQELPADAREDMLRAVQSGIAECISSGDDPAEVLARLQVQVPEKCREDARARRAARALQVQQSDLLASLRAAILRADAEMGRIATDTERAGAHRELEELATALGATGAFHLFQRQAESVIARRREAVSARVREENWAALPSSIEGMVRSGLPAGASVEDFRSLEQQLLDLHAASSKRDPEEFRRFAARQISECASNILGRREWGPLLEAIERLIPSELESELTSAERVVVLGTLRLAAKKAETTGMSVGQFRSEGLPQVQREATQQVRRMRWQGLRERVTDFVPGAMPAQSTPSDLERAAEELRRVIDREAALGANPGGFHSRVWGILITKRGEVERRLRFGRTG